MKLSSFLPRTKSRIIFVVVMASYGQAATDLLRTLANAFGAQRPPLGAFLRDGHPELEVVSLLILAPIIESLVLIAMIELLRWLRSPTWLQISLPALVSAALHVPPVSRAIVVAPSWFIMAAAYIMWRRSSRKQGFLVTSAIHALLNLAGAIWTIGYAIHYQNAEAQL